MANKACALSVPLMASSNFLNWDDLVATPSNFPMLFIFVRILAVSLTLLSAVYVSGRLHIINPDDIIRKNDYEGQRCKI